MEIPPNLQEVARRAGVSIATVSRTIHNTGRVSERTREHIRRVMAELGYKPNRVARRLRSGGSSHLIGLIIPSIQNPFFSELARGVEDVAYQNNFAVFLCNYDESPEKEQFYLDVMKSESVDGIIIPPIDNQDPAVQKFAASGTPVVCVDRSITNASLDKIEVDNYHGALEAMEHLIERGHRRIGFLSGPVHSSTGAQRLAGYHRAIANAGLEEIVRFGDFKTPSGRKLTQEFLALPERPTALFVANGMMAIGALETLNEQKIRIPEEMAFLCFDDLPLSTGFNPPLSVIKQPSYEVGCSATKQLIHRLSNPTAPPASILLRPKLIVRKSS